MPISYEVAMAMVADASTTRELRAALFLAANALDNEIAYMEDKMHTNGLDLSGADLSDDDE